MSDRDVEELSFISTLIPRKGLAVEVGSELGGSAKIILDNAIDLDTLWCFDKGWASPESDGITIPAVFNEHTAAWNIDKFPNRYEYAKSYLSAYDNVKLLPLASPDACYWWTKSIDFMYEDSAHVQPQLGRTLDFWIPRVKPGGIVAGHDYTARWPEVVEAANSAAAKYNAKLNVGGAVWWFFKP